MRALAVFALVGTLFAGAEAAQANPLQKVVQLLSDLEAKIQADGEKEAGAYDAYSKWCIKDTREKGFEIQTATAEIEDLSATISKAATDASTASSRIEDLSASIATSEADLKAATEIRKKERSDFLGIESELVETVDTLDRAVNVLERKGASLAQTKINGKDMSQVIQALSAVLDAAAVSLHDQQKLASLVQNNAGSDDEDGPGAPAGSVYESHSGSIIDLLEDLREKATSELAKARKQETTSTHNYEMLRQSLEDELAQQNKEVAKAKAGKAAALETKAAAESDLAVTKKDLATTQAALEEVKAGCAAAATDHDTSMKSRARELEALAAAKQAIVEKTGAAEGVTYSFMQVESGADLANLEIVDLVRQLAKKTRSPALAQLASRITAVMRQGAGYGSRGPFAKVKGLIEDLLEKLKKEAGADAEHKAYCDDQTAKTNEKREDLEGTVEKLTAKSDKQKARSATLKGEVAELQRELADIAKSQAEMDKVRAEEHEIYKQTKADLEQGLEGVRLALKILQDHYEGPSLAQQPALPTYHENAGGAATGIIGMLEVIESDLGKSLSECQMQEDSAADEYEKVTQENKVTTASKEQDVKYKNEEATALDKSVDEVSADLQSTQTELDAVLDYAKSLREQCVEKPETYEERRARREAELAGLREALEILETQAAMLQRGSHGIREA